MSMTDPIADFLTRIRNAIQAQHDVVEIPASKLKREMARILAEQGYIEGFETEAPSADHPGELIRIQLKYTEQPQVRDLRPPARVPPGPALLRPRHRHPEGAGRHGHRDRLDVPGRHDRPRGPPPGVGGEVVAQGLVSDA